MTPEPDGHRDQRERLGAYVLGWLGDDERTALGAHLDGCASCRVELAELASTADALRGIDPDAVAEPPAAPPPGLADAIGARVRVEGRFATRSRAASGARRSRVLVAVAAVVLAVALTGGGVLGGLALAPDGGPLETVAVAGEAPGIDVRAGVVPHTWGMEVRLTGTGFADGAAFRATVFDEDARPVPAGSFVGTGGREMACSLNSALLRGDATGFSVVDATGATVLAASLPPR